MSDNDSFGAFFAGFVIGGLVGAATALLMAPQSGERRALRFRSAGSSCRRKPRKPTRTPASRRTNS